MMGDHMPDPRDQVELSISLPVAPPRAVPASGTNAKPWLGLFFRCAGAYSRAYRNADGTAYAGRCPKCGKTVRFAVGSGGTAERMFEVEC